MCQGYIVNWTCDASGGNHIVCDAHSATMETFYLNWTDCKYTGPSVYCGTVYDPSQNTSTPGNHFIITTSDFDDHTYPCAAFNLLGVGEDTGILNSNGTMKISVGNMTYGTYTKDQCEVLNSFLWLKKTYNCGEQSPWQATSITKWAHCYQYPWIAWITGSNQFTCDWVKVSPYEVD